jgi:peptide/nickel transport system ATP-binding protein
VTVQAQVLELLATAQVERKMAMILVSHDLGVVAAHTQEIAVMYAGRIVERAPTRTLFANARMPYTEALMRSIPRMTDRPHDAFRVVEGNPPDPTRLPEGCAFSPRCPYVQAQCRRERPPLREEEAGHAFACWFPVGHPPSGVVTIRNADEDREAKNIGGGTQRSFHQDVTWRSKRRPGEEAQR